MNERIIELADKAVEDIPAGAWNIPDEFCEKFAELIIRECVSMAKGFEFAIEQNGFMNPSRYGLSKAMQEHFGVEE